MIKVLVVDDSRSDVAVIKNALKHSDLDYKIVNDSNDALSTAKEYQPDVILLDLMMPNVNGHEVLQAIRTDPATSQIEVVQITASNNIDDLLVSVRLHISDFLIKPIKIDTLVNKIKTISVCKTLRAATASLKNSAECMIEKYA